MFWFASHKDVTEQKAPRAQAPIAISVISAQKGDMPIFLSALGTVQAANTVQLRPMVEGRLETVAFIEGQEVRKGDILAQIDPRPYQAALDQARAKLAQDEAQLDSDRRDLERNITLAERAVGSKQTVDQQRAAVLKGEALVEADKAAIQAARVQLDYTTIRAPFDGRMGIRGVDAGNIVRPSDTTAIASLTQHQPVSVLFSLPEAQIGLLRAAQADGAGQVIAHDSEGAREIASGRIQVIDNQIDTQTGTIRVKAQFPNADNALWPGQFVPVKVRIQMRQNVVALPSAAIQRGPDGLYVWVVGPDKTVKMARVAAGPTQDDRTVIESGVAPGDRVVVAGQYRLRPNAAVQYEEPKVSATEPGRQSGIAR